MKSIRTLLIVFSALICALSVNAVTDKEMEEARTITAKAYLRYANNGSGYLDEISAKTMSQLVSKLKNKEKENLKAFMAVKVPKDYATWNKAKLLEYWGTTFFTAPGLNSDGKGARTRVRKQIGQMSVSAPAPKPTVTAPKPAPAPAPAAVPASQPQTATAPQAAAPATQPVATNPAPATQTPAVDTLTQQVDPALEAEADAATDILKDQNELAEDEAKAEEPRENSRTWLYIIVLVILIAIVVWLVVYAANMMKRQPAHRQPEEFEPDEEEEPERPVRRIESRRESRYDNPEPIRDEPAPQRQFTPAPSINQRFEELQDLRDRLLAEESRNASLSMELEREKRDRIRLEDRVQQLREENSRLQEQLQLTEHRLARKNSEMREASTPRHGDIDRSPIDRERERSASEPSRRSASRSAGELKVIYLGRVNRNGIFVRADRRLSIGNTIYRLDTTDGLVGTFHVVDEPEVVDHVLSNPLEYLSNGCMGEDFEDTVGVTHILTESAGTAIFENGYWKVLRKSRIRYE